MRKSQTATEYLIILAVVIVMGVIAVGVMGGIPSMGGGMSKSTLIAELRSKQVGISAYSMNSKESTFVIVNNQKKAVKVRSVWVDGSPCGMKDGSLFPITLAIGQKKTITCGNIKDADENIKEFNIEYQDTQTDGVFTTGIGPTDFKDTTDVDCWGDMYNATHYQLCTCDDLNLTRTQLSRNYTLMHNIDFFESHCTKYREGEGWDPIGSSVSEYIGHFDGNNKVVYGVYISRSGSDYQGLFGFSKPTTIANLGVIDVDITGNDEVGGLVGYAGECDVQNSYATGMVTGDDDVGGLVGFAGEGNIQNSYATGMVTGDDDVGGLVGYIVFVDISNSYATGIVNGNDKVGGLMGSGFHSGIANSYSTGSVTCTGTQYCGGFVGGPSTSTLTGTNTWVNHSDDTATGCVGQGGTLAGTSVANCTP
ncbi:MAG: GLUG motif-containing protein [Nanoarchaeota archaeon]